MKKTILPIVALFAMISCSEKKDIHRDGLLHMNIDLGVHGVGGINTWGSRTLQENTLPGGQRYEYGFILNIK